VVAALVGEGLLSLPDERVGKDGRIQKARKSSKQSDGDAGDGEGAEESEPPKRKRFVKLYKEFGSAKALAIEILPDLDMDALTALADAIQERLDDNAK